MINLKKRLLCLSVTWLSLTMAMAANTVTVNNNNETLSLPISNNGLTRIEVKQARIQRINHDSPDLEIQADETTGHIFIQPRSEQRFNLYLSTEDNLSYHLALTPQTQASAPIIIDSKVAQRARDKPRIEQDDYAKTLITLMQHLARAQIPPGFVRADAIKRLLPEDLSVQADPLYSYENSYLRGEVFQLKNISPQPLALSPTQFQQAGVVAVALSPRQLAPDEPGRLYLIWQGRN